MLQCDNDAPCDAGILEKPHLFIPPCDRRNAQNLSSRDTKSNVAKLSQNTKALSKTGKKGQKIAPCSGINHLQEVGIGCHQLKVRRSHGLLLVISVGLGEEGDDFERFKNPNESIGEGGLLGGVQRQTVIEPSAKLVMVRTMDSTVSASENWTSSDLPRVRSGFRKRATKDCKRKVATSPPPSERDRGRDDPGFGSRCDEVDSEGLRGGEERGIEFFRLIAANSCGWDFGVFVAEREK
ncbi:hypothetical protein Cni_G25949 [Canna indica]|uniref:Uncharacterized protein n=1 Tax=Canna indica TaxID=4628 RepID=A0AAQ3QQW0_9LILI|nr:hypothetical protein Cni_G25949 [Canna indica]